MQVPLQITLRGMDRSEALTRRIEKKSAALERFASNLTSCHVTIARPSQHSHKGAVFSVRVDLRVPGERIVAGGERNQRPEHADVYVAIRDAFSAATRQLEDYTRKRHRKVKRHSLPSYELPTANID